eukprot:SAG25_NODE_109_length_15249_cov_11.793201_1_plen_35_part_10
MGHNRKGRIIASAYSLIPGVLRPPVARHVNVPRHR